MGDLSKNFSLDEFKCKCGCGKAGVKMSLVNKLQAAREVAGIPFVITSGFRCDIHNQAVGGVSNSLHRFGRAADIQCETMQNRGRILPALIEAGFTRIGVADKYIHVDIGGFDKEDRVIWLYKK